MFHTFQSEGITQIGVTFRDKTWWDNDFEQFGCQR